MGFIKKQLHIGGMTCANCQNKIEQRFQNTAGIKNVKVSYSKGTADIIFDSDIISLKDIVIIVKELGYEVMSEDGSEKTDIGRIISFLVIIISFYVLLQRFGILNLLVPAKLADTKMGYGMLFIIGLVTSVHCIAMCGGINLSQCISPRTLEGVKKSRVSNFQPTILYNFGRVISYTVIGFILGLIGMLLGGSFEQGGSNIFQGILKLLAGIFMVIMGINMLGIFPWLCKFNIRMPKWLAGKFGREKLKNRQPLLVGLLNGLMPCGPLQSMQIVALASCNPFSGALSMFLFSMGTVPLMLGLGSIISVLGKKFAQKMMNVGAVLVVALGLAMVSQGGSLSGLLLPDRMLMLLIVLCIIGVIASISFQNKFYMVVSIMSVCVVFLVTGLAWEHWNSYANTQNIDSAFWDNAEIVDGIQVVNSTLTSGKYPNITVQAGVPVKWIIDAPEGSINGCNYKVLIQEYEIEYSFEQGKNVIEFTPTKTGTIQYSCWMGMIRGNITVLDGDDSVKDQIEQPLTDDSVEGQIEKPLANDSAEDQIEQPLVDDSCCN